MPYHEFYVGEFQLTINDRGHLEIRLLWSSNNVLIYNQCLPSKPGRLDFPQMGADVLTEMRMLMVLDDLASV